MREGHPALYRTSPYLSLSRESERFSSQSLHVAPGGDTKEAFVVSIEVGSVLIPDTIGRAGRIQVFREHQTTGLLKSQPLLELHGAHRGDGLEVMVEARNAHA